MLFIHISYCVVSFEIKLAFTKNLLKCNSDFSKKSRLAATFLRVGHSAICGTVWICRIPADSSALGISHEAGESILCMRNGYAALHKLLSRNWDDRTTALFCCICRPNSNSLYFYRTTLCQRGISYADVVCLCGVDIAYRRLSDRTHLQLVLHS